VLCLRILQAALVYVNTLMVQDVLADQMWADRLTAEDTRGLTPLFWATPPASPWRSTPASPWPTLRSATRFPLGVALPRTFLRVNPR
jgi:hypothetical protein